MIITSKQAKDEDLQVDEEMDENEVNIAYDIASYPSDLTLSVIREMWKNKDIEVPDFQRNFVWNIKQASLLIESFLVGLPVPQVFFYVDDRNKSLVIDGQQRIMSVVFYMEGYFGQENLQGRKQVFRLQGLDEESPYAQKLFSELSESSQRKLKGAVLRAINIRQLNPKGVPTSVYHIFERLNTGGTPLKPQEIRNCVFRGGIVKILRELNEDKNWRKIIGKTVLDKHQKDIELILRIFGLTYYFDDYDKPMKEFLNRTMEREADGTSPKILKFQKDFIRATAEIISRLGEKPFHVRGPLNSSAMDAIFATILNSIGKLPKDLEVRFQNLLADEGFKETTFYSTSDLGVVKTRFAAAKKFLIE